MVITEVPALDSPDVWHNLAVPFSSVFASTGASPENVRALPPLQQLALRTPVFHRGEVLIVDADGREVCGHGRKPSKWGVTTETFATIDEAVARARALLA